MNNIPVVSNSNKPDTAKTITSLELVKQINFFRSESENKSELAHGDLLKVIRDEFKEEIGIGNISETPYTHPQNGQEYPMFQLTLSQAKQVLVRESKVVRKAIIRYIEGLEDKVELTPAPVLSLADMLIQAGNEIKAKEAIINQREKTIESQNINNSNLLTLKATQTKTGIKAIKNDIGAEINIFINKVFPDILDYRKKCLTAHKQYYFDTGKHYLGAKKSSLHSKEDYLQWAKSKLLFSALPTSELLLD